jgi:hypothetical protein
MHKPKKGMIKAVIKGAFKSLKPKSKDAREAYRETKAYEKSIRKEFKQKKI